MIALPLHITLQEPMLATSLEGDPNSATSYPYIPGSLIRGALATRYWRTHQLEDMAVDETAERLFFSGETRFLNAYLIDREGRRTLPVSLSWMIEKGTAAPTRITDGSVAAEELDMRQPQTLGDPFCRLAGDVVEVYRPLRRFSVHTQRDRQLGRATKDSGAVFRYEALAAGQRFDAAILFDHKVDVDILCSMLTSDPVSLGGSHHAGYGLVSVKVGEPQANWREIDRAPADILEGQTFTLTLLSDALLRGADGQYTTAITEDMLAGWLGVRSVRVRDVFKRSGVIGGFNRKWGLPLPQTPIIRAGSVFVLVASELVSAAAIARLESRGIGYRRVDGLGRAIINWSDEEELWLQRIEPEPPPRPSVELADESLRLAQQMLKRLLQREVDDRLTDYVNDLRFRPSGIAASQLARLRVIVRSAQTDNDTQRVLDWLEELKPTARNQFTKARVRGARLLTWLKYRLETPSNVWAEVGLQEDRLPSIGQEQAELTEALAREITLRLVDSVLGRAIMEVKGND